LHYTTDSQADYTVLPDLPALQQLASALWREDPLRRGAAVLVGAGFSRNATVSVPGVQKPPLWEDLSWAMSLKLYPNDPTSAPSDPLRLAEEFRAYLGQTALDELIRANINDDAWSPGEVHRLLLELPWSDVLTTNWDTLLERAAKTVSVGSYYETVRSTADLAHARAPRIVKLHGSIGANTEFVIAEEDYRTYPQKSAAFVNLARQVFIENELCLLGFSGDDPNFLQWSGWVRDQLGGSARRIYLVGDLELAPAKRKFLESRNVAPIDFSSLLVGVRDRAKRHELATRLFLRFLAEAQPKALHEWRPTKEDDYGFLSRENGELEKRKRDDEHSASLLRKSLAVWKRDRENYPGWLVCPSDRRREIGWANGALPSPSERLLELLGDETGAHYLYELVWRLQTALIPINRTVFSLLASIADPGSSAALSKDEKLEIVVSLVCSARTSRNAEAFDLWIDVLEANSTTGSDFAAEAIYQKALYARSDMNFDGMLVDADALIAAPDPIWRLRLACLYCDVCEFEKAGEQVSAALRELDELQRENRNSLWVRSRRAWGVFLNRALRVSQFEFVGEERWPLEFEASRCDPWSEIRHIEADSHSQIKRFRENSAEVIPRFKAGFYTDNTGIRETIGLSEINAAVTLDEISSVVGFSPRLGGLGIVDEVYKEILEITFDPESTSLSWYIRLLWTLKGHSDLLIDRYFSRVGVARMSAVLVEELTEVIVHALEFWRKKLIDQKHFGTIDTSAVERLRLFIELLARLMPRQSSGAARSYFDLAMDLAGDAALSHWWLFESIGHLAEYSVESIDPSEREELVLQMLCFPLSNEKEHKVKNDWPNPFSWVHFKSVARPSADIVWDERIRRLIAVAASDDSGRDEAVYRLTSLSLHKLLKDDERIATAKAVWSVMDGMSPPLPVVVDLLPHAFAILPVPQGVDVERVLRERLYNPQRSGDLARRLQHVVAAASQGLDDLLPNREQALKLFDEVCAWRPRETEGDHFLRSIHRGDNREMKKLICEVFRFAIFPKLLADDLTRDRLNIVLYVVDDVKVSSAIGVLPYFFGNPKEDFLSVITQRIHAAFVSRNSEDVFGAVEASEVWAMMYSSNDRGLPRTLVEQLLAAIEQRGEVSLPSLIGCARKLVEADVIERAEDMSRLAGVLSELMADTDYKLIDPESRAAVTVSLVRAECVRLANLLKLKGCQSSELIDCLTSAERDELPEVRFALRQKH
tara:strand:- start:11718 stop:15377 length:3660 start_codon:yes stop_codon:yes gene_type:complete